MSNALQTGKNQQPGASPVPAGWLLIATSHIGGAAQPHSAMPSMSCRQWLHGAPDATSLVAHLGHMTRCPQGMKAAFLAQSSKHMAHSWSRSSLCRCLPGRLPGEGGGWVTAPVAKAACCCGGCGCCCFCGCCCCFCCGCCGCCGSCCCCCPAARRALASANRRARSSTVMSGRLRAAATSGGACSTLRLRAAGGV